ncbi:hypothetical protein QZH41_015008 [Actinostola sp. cb2023]|nr:hypothetical protein QZH41_015008 [Actinostola sp. cb2023]
MRVAALIFMILLALILESTVASPGKGKKGSGRYRGYRGRRYRRSYCRPYQRRDCLVTMWSEWCSCSHGCGNSGVRSRTRQIISPAKCGGRSCPLLKEEQACNRKCSNGGVPQSGYCKCLPGYTGKCCQIGNGQGTSGFCASKPDGVYPYPKDCGSFYHCSHGISYIKKCPANLRWNQESKTCDWPHNVKCGQGQFQKQTNKYMVGWCRGVSGTNAARDVMEVIRFEFVSAPTPNPNRKTTRHTVLETEFKVERAIHSRFPFMVDGLHGVSGTNAARLVVVVIRSEFVSVTTPSLTHSTIKPTVLEIDCKHERAIHSHVQVNNCAWENWTKWSQCTANCGCGSHKRTRQCTCSHGNGYKKRGYYGKRCYGNSVENGKCNCQDCPGPHVKTVPIGCYGDKNAPNRALPDFVANFYGETSAVHKIESCAHLAKNLKVKIFGMQDEGECWVDLKGTNNYDKHGKRSNCKDGIGGDWTNFVHKIIS